MTSMKRVAGGVAATAGVALALIGASGVAQAADGLGPVTATATTVVGTDQLIDTVHSSGLVYERTLHADGTVSGPYLMDENGGVTAIALATKPNGDAVRVEVKNGQLDVQQAHNGNLWGPGTVLSAPEGNSKAVATTVLSNGDQLIDSVTTNGLVYERTLHADGTVSGPNLMDESFTASAVALATKPNGDVVRVTIDNGQLDEQTAHNGLWGPGTVVSGGLTYASVATTVLPNGDQLVDVIDSTGRTYEITNYAAGFSNGPYILDENTGSTAVALATEANGDAVQDVVHAGAVQQRVKHNGGWSRDTTQIG
ncbi:hypothetical protein [Kutzneria sp. CA-103260]|uniref:hypothetical protein n=1 Tax=Kutzneria sp. CA-103260 TaxID=2802641 RepID=UPI001BAB2F0F|nr:hypothetical protein [Kutzneria sp. CA-103260]